jgi:hypothetical protein
MDARMVLDQSSESDIPQRLAEMASGTDKALAYLILGTDWVATYLRGRGVNTAAILWDQKKREVLAGLLDGDALAALQELPGVQPLKKAAHALRTGHSFLAADNPDLFAVAGAR